MTATPQPKEDETRAVKSDTMCNLEDAEQTLSGNQVHPDAAQKIVQDYRERQANGEGEKFEEKLQILKTRLKKGSIRRLRKLKRKN